MFISILMLIIRFTMLMILAFFLGWMFFTLWRDLNFQTSILIEKKIPHISIYKDDDPGESKRIFTHPVISIGREKANDIQINDETVSAFHARVTFHNKQWWVEDLDSTNGTLLNEEKVETSTILVSGDELIVGKIILKIEIQPN